MSTTMQTVYKSNYEAMQVLPLVQKLKQENRALKMENKKLLGALMNLLSLVEPDNKKPKSRSMRQSTSQVKPLRKQPVVDIKIEPTDCNTGFAKQNLDSLNGDFVPVHKVNLHKILQTKKNKPNLTIDTDCVIVDPPKSCKPNIVYEIEEEEEADTEVVAEEEAADACEEAEEEEVKEVIINKKTYYTDDEKNGTIYDVDENGDVSLEVGKFVKGVAKFY